MSATALAHAAQPPLTTIRPSVLPAAGRCTGGDIAASGKKPEPNDAVHVPDIDVQAVLDNNLTSTILICQRVARNMIPRRSGRIINVSSVAGLAVAPGGAQASYAGDIHSLVLAPRLRHVYARSCNGCCMHVCVVAWRMAVAKAGVNKYTKMLAAQLLEVRYILVPTETGLPD